MSNILYAEESYEIIGACMCVHSNLGSGFSEPVYQEALKYEFQGRNIPHSSQPKLRIRYNNIVLGKYYRADFLCFQQIIIEIKATPEIYIPHKFQLLNYLRATGFELGMLVNFGGSSLKYHRMINSR